MSEECAKIFACMGAYVHACTIRWRCMREKKRIESPLMLLSDYISGMCVCAANITHKRAQFHTSNHSNIYCRSLVVDVHVALTTSLHPTRSVAHFFPLESFQCTVGRNVCWSSVSARNRTMRCLPQPLPLLLLKLITELMQPNILANK